MASGAASSIERMRDCSSCLRSLISQTMPLAWVAAPSEARASTAPRASSQRQWPSLWRKRNSQLKVPCAWPSRCCRNARLRRARSSRCTSASQSASVWSSLALLSPSTSWYWGANCKRSDWRRQVQPVRAAPRKACPASCSLRACAGRSRWRSCCRSRQACQQASPARAVALAAAYGHSSVGAMPCTAACTGSENAMPAASIMRASRRSAGRRRRGALKLVWLQYDKCIPFWGMIELG